MRPLINFDGIYPSVINVNGDSAGVWNSGGSNAYEIRGGSFGELATGAAAYGMNDIGQVSATCSRPGAR